VGDRLIDAECVTERVAKCEMFVGLLLVDTNDLSHCFYYSGKHKIIYDL
jgi:hypothetical protein